MKLDAMEEQEKKAIQELLEEQLEDWGRTQKDKALRSKIPKIKEKSQGGKREQEQKGEGARKKKLKYRREEDDWGETKFPSTDIRKRYAPSSPVGESTNTLITELQPLEQRSNPRRS